MRRRTLLQMPALAGLAQVKSSGFKLSVRVEPLFPKMALAQQMEKVAEAKYQGFEFGNWRVSRCKYARKDNACRENYDYHGNNS